MSEVGQIIDRTPFNRFHAKLLAIGGSGYLCDALDVGIIAFVLPAIARTWGLSSGQVGIIAAAASIGGILGAYLAGIFGDRWGRRKVMIGALAIYSLATMVTALATGWLMLLVSRIVAGIGTSAESVIISPYLSEFVPSRLRGRFIGSLTGFFSFGFLASALLGYFLVPASEEHGWRWALAVASLPILLLPWWRKALPESPAWLEAQGRRDEALAVCRRITGERIEMAQVASPAPAHNPEQAAISASEHSIWSSSYRRSLISACIVWSVMGVCYYAFLTWIPSLLIARGLTISTSFGFSIAIFGAQIPGFFSAAALNDLLGSRRVVILYLTFGMLSALALSVAETNNQVLLSSVLLSFSMNGVYSGLYAYTPSLFPVHIRTTGQGVAVTLSRVGAFVSPILVGYLYPVVGFLGIFGAATALLGTAILVLMVSRAPNAELISLNSPNLQT